MTDYIEREAVIAAMNSEGYTKNMRVHKKVLSIPAADVRPVVRGEWLRKPDPYEFFDTIPVCSNCGCTTKWREEYPHCPNCGAEMKPPKEDV